MRVRGKKVHDQKEALQTLGCIYRRPPEFLIAVSSHGPGSEKDITLANEHLTGMTSISFSAHPTTKLSYPRAPNFHQLSFTSHFFYCPLDRTFFLVLSMLLQLNYLLVELHREARQKALSDTGHWQPYIIRYSI